MKPVEEQLKHFREDMDNLLNDLKTYPELKRRVLDKIYQPRMRLRKLSLSIVTVFVFFILIGSALQIPSVKAQVLPALSTVVGWIEQVTKIPVRLPSSWQPAPSIIKESPTKAISNYYFQARRTPDGYSINVYDVAVPVPFNDEAAVLEKNGPLSESQQVGFISGSKLADNLPALQIKIPSDSQPFELIPGVTAYERYQGTNILWKQGNWGFEYIGSSGVPESPGSIDDLKGFAAIWPNSLFPLADTGYVKIVEGNRRMVFITWDQDGVRYTLQTTGDSKQVAQLLDSLREWRKTNH